MARRLYLMRHAKSDWGDRSLPDFERPLNERGRRSAEAMARHLREAGVGADLVICSPAVRTRETLAGLAGGLGVPMPPVEFDERLYEATAGALLDRVREIPDDVHSALLVGHNPATHDLAVLLAGAGSDRERMAAKFPTAALATLRFEGDWVDLNPSWAALEAFVTPRDLA